MRVDRLVLLAAVLVLARRRLRRRRRRPRARATPTTPTETAATGDAGERQGGVRLGRLRRLPHVLGGRVDRQHRAEPRRRVSVVRQGRDAGDERRRRDAVVRGQADRSSRSRTSPRSSRARSARHVPQPSASGRRRPSRLCLQVRVRTRSSPNVAHRARDPLAGGRERVRARPRAGRRRSRPAACTSGMPAVADLAHAGRGVSARRLELDELLDARRGAAARARARRHGAGRRSPSSTPHAGRSPPGSSTRTSRRPTAAGTRSGARRSTSTSATELDALAHAAPAASADAFDGDTRAFVDDLYGCAVDELARRALRAAGVALSERLAPSGRRRRAVPRGARGASAGAAGRRPDTPRSSGGSRAWVDGGLARRSRAPWNLGLRLDEAEAGPSVGERPVVLELWLEAADDPTLALPAALLERGARRGVRVPPRQRPAPRARPPARDDRRRSSPTPASTLAGDPPTRVVLDTEQVRAFLRGAMPRLEELGVPVRLPREWVSSSSRVRVNLVATGVAGDVERAPHARRDRVVRLAPRDRRRRADGGGAPRARGREGAARSGCAASGTRSVPPRSSARSASSRRPRPRRRCRRARPGGRRVSRRTRPASSSGEVRLDAGARRSPRRSRRAALPAAPDARRDASRPVPVPGARPRLAAAARRPARRRDPRRRHGAREDGPGDRDPRLGARGGRRGRRADARRQPDERRRSSGRARSPASRPGSRVHLHHGPSRLTGDAFVAAAGASDVVVTSYDVATRDVELLVALGVGPAAPRRGAGREEPADEAPSRAPADPAPAGARAHGHAHREPARRALGDHGPRQPRACSAHARRSSARSPARSRRGGTRRRSSGSARSSARSSSAGRRTRPRSTSSCRRSRSRRCRAT